MKSRALLIHQGEVFAPTPMGIQDVLIINEQIVAIGSRLEIPSWCDGTVISAKGHMVFPGFVDQHVHLAGGGGEGGPEFRTPEISLTALTKAGVTTAVGVLGTDGTTRSVAGLLAAARGLEAEGLSTFIYTGAYEVPTRTITDTPRNDVVLIDKVIGIGEIAVSDHRGSHPSDRTLAQLASEARVGGLLSGKAGVLHLHLGSGPRQLQPVYEVLAMADIPINTFVPTHLNRNSRLLSDAVELGHRGGWLDLTTGIVPTSDDPDAVDPADAMIFLRDQGVPWNHISFSSDAQGSAPTFDAKGHLTKMAMGSATTTWQAVLGLVQRGIPWHQAIEPVTSTPATILQLSRVGRLEPGAIAHLVLIQDDTISKVVSKGTLMVDDARPIVFGPYEQASVR